MSLPARLAAVVDDFAAMAPGDRLELLLEYADGLPDLPERYREHLNLLERVPECQTPLFLGVEVDADAAAPVHLFFHAPREAPTTRGFAGILHAGLDGETAEAVLSVPAGVLDDLRLGEVVSPLRMRGMSSMLARIQQQVTRARSAAPTASTAPTAPTASTAPTAPGPQDGRPGAPPPG